MFRTARMLGVGGSVVATASVLAPRRERVAPTTSVSGPEPATQWRAGPSVAQCEDVNPIIYAAGAAAIGVAWYMFGGESTTVDNDAALALFTKSVSLGKRGDIAGQTKLLKEAAEMGSSGAMVEYGLCLTYGKGTLKNEKAGIVQFKKAAAAGDAYALTMLGAFHDQGIGVEKDPAMALKYFQEAAAKDEPEACYYLAFIYIYGDNSIEEERDLAKGVELLKRSADLGYPPAIERYPMVKDLTALPPAE